MKSIILLVLILLVPFQVFANQFDANMNAILKDYLKIQELLSQDDGTGISELSKTIHKMAMHLSLNDAPKQFVSHYKNIPNQIREASLKLSKGGSIDIMREAFKNLSRPIANWVEMHQPKNVVIYFCSMANSSWVQKSTQIANPYYGKKMLNCGELVKHYRPDHDHEH